MDEKIFAEYDLLGTMFSVLYTFLVFEFMKYILVDVYGIELI